MWRAVWYHVWLEDNSRFSSRACYPPIHGLLTQLTALGMGSALHPIRVVGYPSLPARVTIHFLLRCKDYLRREDKRTKCNRQFREDCCKPVCSRYDSVIAHKLIVLWLTAQDLDIVKPGKSSVSDRRAHGVRSLSDEPFIIGSWCLIVEGKSVFFRDTVPGRLVAHAAVNGLMPINKLAAPGGLSGSIKKSATSWEGEMENTRRVEGEAVEIGFSSKHVHEILKLN